MNILIIEDEHAAARRLAKMLVDLQPASNILPVLDSVESAVCWLQENPPPDLIFMDIHLADGSSFEIFDHVCVNCPVVFATAYDQYALKAFKVSAVDYLLKPVKPQELAETLEKWKQRASVGNHAALAETLRQAQPRQWLRRILVRMGHALKLINIADAAYFYTKDKITFLVPFGAGKRFPIDASLDKLEGTLDPDDFFRINRQFIINIKAIKEMHAYSKSRVKIVLEPPADQDTIVSAERSAAFKNWLVGGCL